MMESFCKNNEQKRRHLYLQKSFIIDNSRCSKYASGLNFMNFSIQFTLYQRLKCCWRKLLSTRSWQNLKTSTEKKFSSVSKYFNFRGSSPNIKRTLFPIACRGRLFLKLSYWNKSIQRINIIITTNECQKQTLTILEKFPRKHIWGGSVISKNLISHFDMNVFPRVAWIFSQLKAFVLKLQQKKNPWRKIYCMENCLSFSIFTY